MTNQIMFEGIILYNVHDYHECQYDRMGEYVGRTCIIHQPTPHHMRLWTLHWRDDRGIFERLCRHGISHPDPDQFAFWRERGSMYQSLHSCDGCCRPPFPGDKDEEARWSIWPGRSTGTATTVSASDGSTWELANSVASLNRRRSNGIQQAGR